MACLWQPDSKGIVMSEGAAVKLVWRIAATPTKFPSRTWPPSLPHSNNGNALRPDPCRPSQRRPRSRPTGTGSIRPRSSCRCGFCSPKLPFQRALQAGRSGVEVAQPMDGKAKCWMVNRLTLDPALRRLTTARRACRWDQLPHEVLRELQRNDRPHGRAVCGDHPHMAGSQTSSQSAVS